MSITRGIPAALSGYGPGMGIAGSVLGQAFIGCTVLLSDFTIGLSTESTGLSSHPVHNFNLNNTTTVQGLNFYQYGDVNTLQTKRYIQIKCITFNAFESKKTS